MFFSRYAMHKLTLLYSTMLVLAIVSVPSTSVMPSRGQTDEIINHPTIHIPSRASASGFHDFWSCALEWLRTTLQQKRNFLQELVGSMTNRFVLLQYVYAITKTVTSYDGASIDTSQSEFGGASGKFVVSSSQYLSIPDSADWAFGTGDFTIDFWVRFNSLSTTQYFWNQYVDVNDRIGFGWQVGTGKFEFYVVSGGSVTIDFTSNGSLGLSTNTWYHIAIVRSGNSWYMFLDGTSMAGAYTNSNSVVDIAASALIGSYAAQSGFYVDGWLDEYRVSKGIARWSSNFTPANAPYQTDSYTVLLLHMDGTMGSTSFLDSSAVVGPDFTITPTTSSQSVGAGSTAAYTLNLAAVGGYTGTVNSLIATSGCPSGVICTVTPSSISSFPNTATLSVPTLITTPSGTTTVTVTATDTTDSITHTITVSLTVAGPASLPFNVKGTATQVVVTLTYSWAGSGAPPQATISIGPSGGTTLSESAGTVYDRTTISVAGASNTYNLIHRVTFPITAPGSAAPPGWIAYVSLAGVSSYTLTIEVS